MIDIPVASAEIKSIRTTAGGYEITVECPFCGVEFDFELGDKNVECDGCYTGDQFSLAVIKTGDSND